MGRTMESVNGRKLQKEPTVIFHRGVATAGTTENLRSKSWNRHFHSFNLQRARSARGKRKPWNRFWWNDLRTFVRHPLITRNGNHERQRERTTSVTGNQMEIGPMALILEPEVIRSKSTMSENFKKAILGFNLVWQLFEDDPISGFCRYLPNRYF